MLKITGNDVRRGGVKIGWIEGNDIKDENGKKLGYFTGNDIYKVNGAKLGFTSGNDLYFTSGRSIRLDDIRTKYVVGGGISDLARAAVLMLIGD